MTLDLAVLGQDPRYGGGFFSFASSFCRASEQLGRDPHLLYLSRIARSGPVRPEEHPPFRGVAYPSPVRELDAAAQLLGARRMLPAARTARSLWVVAASAPYGAAAPRSGRPYACWLATGLESEWASRRAELPWSRRAALTLNAPLLRRLERDVIRGARLVFGISPASRDTIAEGAGVERERVGWLPVPVDVERLRPEPDDEWRARLEHPVIAFLGRGADPRKNVRLLLDALPAIRRRIPDATVRLIGELPPGPFPVGVEAIGPVDDVLPHLRTASLFVLPSLQEGFGIAVAESLAAGVPALVTPSGGPEEIVQSSGGGRVLVGFEPEELAAAAVEMLEDAEGLAAMRTRGRAYVEREHAPARLRELLAAAFEELDG